MINNEECTQLRDMPRHHRSTTRRPAYPHQLLHAQARGGVFSSDEQASAVHKAAHDYAVKASLLDLMFLHPPSLIALASVLTAAGEVGVGEPMAKYVSVLCRLSK